MPAHNAAVEHMGQGSWVETSRQSERSLPIRAAARRMACISAWAVGSPLLVSMSWARARTVSFRTSTAPKPLLPSRSEQAASSRAKAMN